MSQAAILPQIADLQLKAGEGGRLMVYFPYHPDTISRIKTIPGRRWHPDKKCWSVPHTVESLRCLQRLFSVPRPLLQVATQPTPCLRNPPPTSEEQAFLKPIEAELKLGATVRPPARPTATTCGASAAT